MVAPPNPSNWRRFGLRAGLLCEQQSDCGPDPLVDPMDRNRRIPLLLAVVVGVLALGGPGSLAAPAKKPAQEAVPGELLIGFRGDISAADQKNVFKSIGAVEKKSFKRIHGSLAHVLPDAVEATLAKLRKDPRIRYAEPNFVVHAEATPNDPSFSEPLGPEQHRPGDQRLPGTPDADIDAAEAWNVTTGSAGVVGRGDRHRRRLVASRPRGQHLGQPRRELHRLPHRRHRRRPQRLRRRLARLGLRRATTTTRWTTTATARTSPARSAPPATTASASQA